MQIKPVKLTLAAMMVLALMPFQPAYADAKEKGTLSLTGTGSVNVSPDMAILNFGVVEEAKTAREALNLNNEAMGRILAAMKDNDIEEKDLQTSGFSIQPKYVYPKRTQNGEQPAPEITGYRVLNQLTVRIRDIEKLGSILDLSVTLGMNSGGDIRFTNADTKEIIKEARTLAVKDAIEKAQTLVGAAGVELGEIRTISENVTLPRPVAIAQARSLSVQEDASVPIASGENQYSVTVQMSWEIDQ